MTNIQVGLSGIYILVALLLIIAATGDIRTRTIPNRLTLAVGLLGFGVLCLNSIPDSITHSLTFSVFLYPVLAALSVFGLGVALFALGLMGGGDVKLMAAFALIAGPDMTLPFLTWTALAGGLVAFGMLVHIKLTAFQRASQTTSGMEHPAPPTVPYGVAISAAGLWVCARRLTEVGFFS